MASSAAPIQLIQWPAGPGGLEWALALDRRRTPRLLVLPPLFDEANKMRHFLVGVMRRLDQAGIDTALPDLPGTNESLAPLETQTLRRWQECVAGFAAIFGASHVLAVRGSAILTGDLARIAILYAPIPGGRVLRALIRQQALAAREAGETTSRADWRARALATGAQLAGFALGAQMARGLEEAQPPQNPLATIAQAQLGDAGLWLRAEPSANEGQAASLAQLLVAQIEKAPFPAGRPGP